jgi:hypothetical protein
VQGFKPKRSLEVMMFTSEEPTRFKLSCIGSRAMSGALTADVLDVKLDENGTDFRKVSMIIVSSTNDGGGSCTYSMGPCLQSRPRRVHCQRLGQA